MNTATARAAEGEPFDLDAAQKQHGRRKQQHDEDAGKMALQRDEAAQDDHDRAEGRDAIAEGAHFIAVGRDHGGKRHDDGDFRKLRGLEADARNLDPALCAVGRRADERYEHQEHDGYREDDERSTAPELIVQPADKQHTADAHDSRKSPGRQSNR